MNRILLVFPFLMSFFWGWSQCGGSSVSSLIPNPSFESQSCCPSNHSQMTCADNWIQASNATTDYLNTCGYSSTPSTQNPPTPLPDGSGYVGIYDGSNSSGVWKEYLGVCLSSPLVAGTSYTLQLSMAAAVGTGSYSGSSFTNREFVIYGASNCTNLPFSSNGCPTSGMGYSVVHSQTVTLSTSSWTVVSFTFTPSFNIYGFVFGGNCSSTTGGMTNSTYGNTSNYYFLDNIILNTSTAFDPPVADAGSNITTTCSSPTATLNGSATGGTAPYSYSWSNGAGSSQNPTVDPASTTTYTLTVTDNNGCTDTDAVTVTVNEAYPTANAGSDATTTCSSPTTTLSASGGTSYSWSPSTGLSSSTSATPTANPSSTTTYTVTATASNGCTDTDQVTVTVNETPPTANAGSDVTIDCNSTSGQETLNGSGSSSGMTYAWSTGTGNIVSGGSTTTPTVDAAGTYTITVTNTTNGCSATDNVVVSTDFVTPTANAGSDASVDCITTSTTLNGSGGSSYSWSPSTGLSSTTSASPTASPTTTTTYTLTVTGTNGCTDTDDVVITYDGTAPSVDAGSDVTTDCNTPTTTLSGSGTGTSYSWSPSTGLSNANITNPTADPTSTTTYTLTATGANGCTSTDQVTVTVDETAPIVSAGSDITIDCNTTSANFTATGASSYSWSTPDGSFTSSTITVDDSWTNGTFTVTGTATNGCSNTDDAILTIDTISPIADAGNDQISSCATPVVTLDGSGSSGTSLNYNWSGGTIISGANTSSATTSTPGIYTLTVTDANGCSGSDDVEVIPDSNTPTADAGFDATLTCSQTLLTIGGSGTTTGSNISYTWTTPSGNIVSGSTSANASIDDDGDYTLTVLDNNNGCSSSDDVSITYDTITPIASVAQDELTLNCSVLNVSADAGSSSGTNNTYNWTTTNGNIVSGQNTSTPTFNQPGLYQLTVTSDNDCENLNNSDVLVVIDTLTPQITLTNSGDFDCDTDTINITAEVDTTVEYLWIGNDIISGDTLEYITINSSGTYQLTVTNPNNGCSNAASIEIANICSEEIIIPNIFSPNGDNENDVFKINGSHLESLNGTIMNRWGQVLFEWSTVDGGWDGFTLSGVESASGTYYYIITYTTPQGDVITETGPLQLVR